MMDRVNIRMSRLHLDEIEVLNDSGMYPSQSEVMRDAYRVWREVNADRIAEAHERMGKRPPVGPTPKEDVQRIRELREAADAD